MENNTAFELGKHTENMKDFESLQNLCANIFRK